MKKLVLAMMLLMTFMGSAFGQAETTKVEEPAKAVSAQVQEIKAATPSVEWTFVAEEMSVQKMQEAASEAWSEKTEKEGQM